MKRLFILAIAAMSVALLFAASRASAADLPVRPGPPAYYPVAAVYDWGGGYIGVNGGYAFGQSQWSDALNPNVTAGVSQGVATLISGIVGGQLQLALDNGAQRVLLPTGNRAQFSSLPEDVIEKLDIIFYSDVDRAVARVVEL